MRTKLYQRFGATAACTLRAVDKVMKYDFFSTGDKDNDKEDTEETEQQSRLLCLMLDMHMVC